MTERLAVAVDVGGTTVKAGLVDGAGTIHQARRTPVADVGRPQLVHHVLDTIDDLTRAGGRDVVAVGLTVAGLVDEHAGVAVSSMFLGWHDVPFVDLLLTGGLPVAFGHDVSAGAFAESELGAAIGHRDWLFVAIGTGVGSTFVLDGRPYRGSSGHGGELAHVVVDPAGPACPCGKRGCLETIASGPAIAAAYATATGAGSVTARDVAARAAAGDRDARRVWDGVIDALSRVLAGYVESMNPSVVVLGGGVGRAGAALIEPLRERLRTEVAFADPAPALLPARFDDDAATVGIGVAALDAAARGDRFAVPYLGGVPHPASPPRDGSDVTMRKS